MQVSHILTSVLAFASLAQSHTILFSANTPTGNVNCIRPLNRGSATYNFPNKVITSNDMICGAAPTRPAPAVCVVPAGGSISLIWGHTRPGDDIIAESHYGPCNVYLARSAGPGTAPPTSGWFKIRRELGIPSMAYWCTTKLIRDAGRQAVRIPPNLAPGDYFLRSELNTLHEAEVLASAQPARVPNSTFIAQKSASLVPEPFDHVPQILSPSLVTLTTKLRGVRFNIYGYNVAPSRAGPFYPNPFAKAIATLTAPAVTSPSPSSRPPASSSPRPSPSASPRPSPSPSPRPSPSPSPRPSPTTPPPPRSTLITTLQSAYCIDSKLIIVTSIIINPTPSTTVGLKTHTGRITRNGRPVRLLSFQSSYNMPELRVTGSNTFSFRETNFVPGVGFQMVLDVACSYSGVNVPSTNGILIAF
ncbi:glycosyl hydrolase family 61-domain-containing protein [Chytridium lagenaria]|nr:glycosyl hydrolase family 61-domain-containing protein [Chytridium lagenaria]